MAHKVETIYYLAIYRKLFADPHLYEVSIEGLPSYRCAGRRTLYVPVEGITSYKLWK